MTFTALYVRFFITKRQMLVFLSQWAVV